MRLIKILFMSLMFWKYRWVEMELIDGTTVVGVMPHSRASKLLRDILGIREGTGEDSIRRGESHHPNMWGIGEKERKRK